MEEYELDTFSDQIVHWLSEELAQERPRVSCVATRDFVSDERADLQSAGLSEDADAKSLVTVGMLEITPLIADEGWRLTVRVEDTVGAHTPEDSSVPDYPEEIDLDDFQNQFTASDNCTEFVTLRADTQSAKRRFDDLFVDIVKDRHRGQPDGD